MIMHLIKEELEHYHSVQAGQFQQQWPFPITNGVRNAENQSLLDNKQKPSTIKPSLDNEQDALL